MLQVVDYQCKKVTQKTQLCYIVGISKQKEPDMKFNKLLDQAAAVVPRYRQTIFRTQITALATSGQPRRISSIFRKFVNLLTGRNTVKRLYNFIHSTKIPWDNLWDVVINLLGDPTIGGRFLIALDDTIYGNTGWRNYGYVRHFDHAAKANASKYIWGHCRVIAGILFVGRFVENAAEGFDFRS